MRGTGISRVFHGIKDQGSNFCGFRDQNSHHFWNEGSKLWVKIWDQLRKNKYMLFTGWEVRIGKNCARGLEYGPRPEAEGRTQG